MIDAGDTHAVCEVTSHGLAQQRVAEIDFDIAVCNTTLVTH
jgi:UDP-N-acetylmuramoyl-L-alanyl-D-glutamate--2,6-diaminopimelate ligase